MFEDHIFVRQFQCISSRFADFWFVVGTQDLTLNLGLGCLDAEVFIYLAFVSLLNTKGRYEIYGAIHHNQTVYFGVLLSGHHRKTACCVLLVNLVYYARTYVAFGEFILNLSENCLNSLQGCLNIHFVRVIIIQKMVGKTSWQFHA